MIVLTSVDRRTKLGSLVLDVLLTEEIDFESQVTLYPTEDGVVITDHITRGAEKIRISGMISTADASGGNGTAAAFGFGLDNSTKLIDVVEACRGMYEARAILTVSTGQLVYEEFAFSSLNLQRSSSGDGGNWVTVKGELTKIRKVKLKKADVPPPENVQAPADGRAGQTNKPAGRTTPSTNNTNQSRAPASSGVGDSTLITLRDRGRDALTNPAPNGVVSGFREGVISFMGIGR